jgi:hypothetical protein
MTIEDVPIRKKVTMDVFYGLRRARPGKRLLREEGSSRAATAPA